MAKADRRYKTIVDDQTEAIITLDGEGRITYINPVLERLSEGSGTQPIGCNIDQLWRAEESSAFRSQISRASPEAPEFQFKHVVPLQEVEGMHLLRQGKVLFDENDVRTEVQAAGMDITVKGKDQAEYQTVVEGLKEIIVRVPNNGTVTLANKAIAHLFNVPREGLVGHRFLPNVDERDLVNFYDAVRDLTPKAPTRDSLILHTYCPDGSYRTTEWRLRGIFDSLGRPLEYQCVGNDTTDMLKMELELNRARKLESIGILAGGIAHEFNNILTSIASNIEVAVSEVSLKEGGRVGWTRPYAPP